MATAKARFEIKASDKTKKAFRSVRKNLKSLRSSVFSTRTAMVGLAGAAGMGLIVRAGLKQIDVIGKMSRLYRISTEDIGAMTLAARVGGTELDTFLKAARNASRQMFDFSRGTGEAKDAMAEMGITVKDIEPLMNDQVELMGFLAGKVNQVESSVDRLAIAQDIFGGRATVVLNVLENGTKTIAAFREEARLLGGTLTKDAVEGVEDANDSFTRLGFLLEGFRNQTVAALAPAIRKGVDAFKDWLLEIAKSEGGIKGFAKNSAIVVLKGTKSMVLGLKAVIDVAGELREKLEDYGVLDKKISLQGASARGKVLRGTDALLSREEALAKFRNDAFIQNKSFYDRTVGALDRMLETTRQLNVETSKPSVIDGGGGDGTEESPRVLAKMEEDNVILDMEYALQDRLAEARKKSVELYESIEKKHTRVLVNLREGAANHAVGLLSALGQKSKTFAKAAIVLQTLLAVKKIIISTRVAAAAALEGPPVGLGPLAGAGLSAQILAAGYASATLVGATGAVQLSNLGGGGVPSGSAANPVNTTSTSQQSQPFQAQQQQPQQTIIFMGADAPSDDQIDRSIERLGEQLDTGSLVLIRRGTPQMQEIAAAVADL